MAINIIYTHSQEHPFLLFFFFSHTKLKQNPTPTNKWLSRISPTTETLMLIHKTQTHNDNLKLLWVWWVLFSLSLSLSRSPRLHTKVICSKLSWPLIPTKTQKNSTQSHVGLTNQTINRKIRWWWWWWW
jgi:hypothetical protein